MNAIILQNYEKLHSLQRLWCMIKRSASEYCLPQMAALHATSWQDFVKISKLVEREKIGLIFYFGLPFR